MNGIETLLWLVGVFALGGAALILVTVAWDEILEELKRRGM